MRKCIKCGADISSIELRRKLFCPECQRKKRNEYKKKQQRKSRKLGDMVVCKMCGQEFEREGSRKTCSPECAEANHKIAIKKAHRNYYLKTERNQRGISDKVKCVFCGKEFPRDKQRNTCSPGCKRLHLNELARKYRENKK